MGLKEKLDSIRVALDADVSGVDIESIVEKGKALAQLIGLSAACKAEAKANLERARGVALSALTLEVKHPPSVLLKLVEAEVDNEILLYEYADRLNAGITHQLDYYRTLISLHKTELETSYKQ